MANGRRKRVVISIEKKLEILDRLSKGKSQAFLSFKYVIGKSTVADLKKNEKNVNSYLPQRYGLYLCGKYEFTDNTWQFFSLIIMIYTILLLVSIIWMFHIFEWGLVPKVTDNWGSTVHLLHSGLHEWKLTYQYLK